MHIKENVILKKYTTLEVGGPARYFVQVDSQAVLLKALDYARDNRLEVLILGSGSNIIISDQGFDGLVIRMNLKGIKEIQETKKDISIQVAAGEDWDTLVLFSVRQGWWGIENLSGIPGTVGAAPVQNINAYGQQISEVVDSIEAIDLTTHKFRIFNRQDCGFHYRQSIFNSSAKNRYVITRVTLKFSKQGNVNKKYEYLHRVFRDPNYHPSLREIREAVLEQRRQRGMLSDMYKSVGSFFKNSTQVPEKNFEAIYKKIMTGREKVSGQCCPDPWFWQPETDSAGNQGGQIKISAACLVHFLFPPGTRQGKVGSSPDHALALVNYDHATTGELLALAGDIRRRVKKEFGVSLDFEPELVGFKV